jgi:signal peptide peptidase SppA
MDRDTLLGRVSARALLMAEHGLPLLSALLNEAPPRKGLLGRVAEAVTDLGRRAAHDAGERTPFAAAYLGDEFVIESDAGFDIVQGVAILEITGMLWDRSRYCPNALWTYDGISRAIEAAATDSRVRAIMLRIESPGGLVEGMFECAQRIRAFSQAAGGGKPIHAVIPGQATSAAYGLASACDRIVAARGAWVASIGSIMVHAEFSKMDERIGLTVTPVRSRENKARQNSYEALSADARAGLEEVVNLADAEFVEQLAELRPQLSAETIDELDGRFVVADPGGRIDVLAVGLVDEIASEREAFAALARLANGEASEPVDPALTPGANAGAIETEEKVNMTRAQMIAALGLSAEAAATLSDAELRARIRAALEAAEDGGEDEDDAESNEDEDDAESNEDEDDAESNEDEDDAESNEDEDDAESNEDEDDAESNEDEDEGEGANAAAPDGQTVLAILALNEAQGRDGLARHLAGQPGMTVERAKATLAAAPKAQSGFPGDLPDPDIAANDGAGGDTNQTEADKIAARAVAAAGVGAS